MLTSCQLKCGTLTKGVSSRRRHTQRDKLDRHEQHSTYEEYNKPPQNTHPIKGGPGWERKRSERRTFKRNIDNSQSQ